jgi:hypothetical protein
MTSFAEDIKHLFTTYKNAKIISVDKLPQSGSDRIYFRIHTDEGPYIATYNENVKENITFFNFSKHFKKSNNPVPEIYIVDDSKTMYIQEDFGDESLLDKLEEHGTSQYVYSLFQKSLKKLARLQIKGDKNLDYDWAITSKEFG